MANMVIHLNNDNTVGECFPEENPDFPGIPLEDRYTKIYLDHCIIISEEEFKEKNISADMIYNRENGEFSAPKLLLYYQQMLEQLQEMEIKNEEKQLIDEETGEVLTEITIKQEEMEDE